jgi:hypothetical protein
MRPHADRFGGSHAQRDLIHVTMLEAAFRAGKGALASALAAERTDVKRSSPSNWRMTARAFALQGQPDQARRASETADLRAAAQTASRESPRAAAA